LRHVAWSGGQARVDIRRRRRRGSLAADDAGNAFVASQLNGGGVQLDRLAAGATTFDTPRTIDVAGGSPITAALPGNSGAGVVYTVGTQVFVTVQAY
jgi:hypothetical protein